MRSIVWLVVVICLLGLPAISGAQVDVTVPNRIIAAAEHEDELNQQLAEELGHLKERHIHANEFLLGRAAAEHYEDCMICCVGDVVSLAEELGRTDLVKQWAPLYGWMLENDLDFCEGGNYYFSQSDEAYDQYLKAGWTYAARRAARTYADWLWQCYQEGGTYGDRYDQDTDEYLGPGPWPFPFDEVVDWYTNAGWTDAQIDVLREQEKHLVIPVAKTE
jgi:hypothetical protein